MTSPFANALILTGPTGSGKSALALDLAERLNAEIVSADSMTLYRGMDIGTAKPSAAERARVPHHLIDVLNPAESANVAWWLREAGRVVGEIESRGRTALIVGGTPFYLKAIICGLFDSPPADQELRRALEEEAERSGPLALHTQLAQVDPISAGRLHPNDVRRVVRAMEVYRLTGKPLSEWQKQSWWDGQEPQFSPNQCLCLDLPRDVLYDRINARVDAMFAAGWVDEVRRLEAMSPGREASMALGYREIGLHLNGSASLQETIDEIKMRTRQFAKRQLTWFRGLAGCEFVASKLTFERWLPRMAVCRT